MNTGKTVAILFVFASESSGRQYQSLQYVDGSMSCDCPGWVYQKKGRSLPNGERTCKHTRWIEAGMAEGHATKILRYADVQVIASRQPVKVVVGSGNRASDQLTLSSQRRRVITLED